MGCHVRLLLQAPSLLLKMSRRTPCSRIRIFYELSPFRYIQRVVHGLNKACLYHSFSEQAVSRKAPEVLPVPGLTQPSYVQYHGQPGRDTSSVSYIVSRLFKLLSPCIRTLFVKSFNRNA